jgi:hypothetical protein
MIIHALRRAASMQHPQPQNSQQKGKIVDFATLKIQKYTLTLVAAS